MQHFDSRIFFVPVITQPADSSCQKKRAKNFSSITFWFFNNVAKNSRRGGYFATISKVLRLHPPQNLISRPQPSLDSAVYVPHPTSSRFSSSPMNPDKNKSVYRCRLHQRLSTDGPRRCFRCAVKRSAIN